MKILVDKMPDFSYECQYGEKEYASTPFSKEYIFCMFNGCNSLCPGPDKCYFFTDTKENNNDE